MSKRVQSKYGLIAMLKQNPEDSILQTSKPATGQHPPPILTTHPGHTSNVSQEVFLKFYKIKSLLVPSFLTS
jgi:hypothetical protein